VHKVAGDGTRANLGLRGHVSLFPGSHSRARDLDSGVGRLFAPTRYSSASMRVERNALPAIAHSAAA
jgi:hypothetical protein